ncbi:hypothetical protein ACFTS5_07250 [Nocardia sp. NPDC056952]|uniref:hypothetical protein n=1 Tax=Nocardia sp. NPDC056952 TaxID=3345979 RepID=UPI00362C815E
MTQLNWQRFEELPGDRRANFELLWRGAIRLTYGRFGTFRALAQQPGVEFHLNIEQDCPLGAVGQWFGWQTKWWEIGSGTQIGQTRRKDVEDSLAKTKAHLPNLNHWVLCTRRPLTPTDQQWFESLDSGISLENLVADDLANLLVGEAALLREAYFGELVLTPHRLTELQQAAVEEVGERWFPQVHQTTAAEDTLQRMLAEPEAWTHLDTAGTEIAALADIVKREVATTPLSAAAQTELDTLLRTAATIRDLLLDARAYLAPDSQHSWLELGDVNVPPPPPRTPPVLRRLRSDNHPASMFCTNLVARTRRAAGLARQVFDELQVRIAVVTGGAGYGKTQLAAKLTGATGLRPPGILLHGRRLGARDDLDRLARQVTVSGRPMQTFEALLAAVDAAAARARCRLPVIIDGLNEAEDPSSWEPLLRKLHAMLKKYPSVLVVCTVRENFVSRAIPTTVTDSVDLKGFTEDFDEVVQKYFGFFNIDAGDAYIPREVLRHPLALRIFCSVANPTRETRVQLALLPRSLNEMFDEYLRVAARRIDQLHIKISIDDVTTALEQLGIEMWKTQSRDVDVDRARGLFRDNGRWEDSILGALEHEGVLIRQLAQQNPMPAGASHTAASSVGGMRVAVVYDLLAGHIIASAMVNTSGAVFANALRTPTTASRFSGAASERHPLASDIFEALVFLLPRAGFGQLWQMVEKPLVDSALVRTTALSAAAVDAVTVEAFTRNFETLVRRGDFWPRLQSARSALSHPLNARYLDTLLRPRGVAERDLLWSEWLRKNAAVMLGEVRALIVDWKNRAERTEVDGLRARWLMWMLTSTVRDLRDAVTAALYWYGRTNPSGVFALSFDALTVNDAYVGERVVAAAYGIATAHQTCDPEFGAYLREYLDGLIPIVTGPQPTAPTYHRLTRYYIAATIAFAREHYPDAVPAALADGIEFANGILPTALHDGDARREEVSVTIHMDFGNYTLGRLFEDRSNYDYDHAGHIEATDNILGVVYDLGWRKNEFSTVDSSIGSHSFDRDPGRTERYGKKYGWIGFYLVSGMLVARGEDVPWLEVDIDPTFPQSSPALPLQVPTWVRPTPRDDRNWMQRGLVRIPDELLYCQTLDGAQGPWVLVHAEIDIKDRQSGRSSFGLFNTVAVEHSDLDALMQWWSTVEHPGRDIIELPAAYYLFAGEIPWHSRMVTSGDDLANATASRTNVPREVTEDIVDDAYDLEDPYIDQVRIYDTKDGAEVDTNGPVDATAEVGENPPGADDDLDDMFEGLASSAGRWPSYRSLRFESMAHSFTWEGYHSSENQEFAYVPSQRLSQQSRLRAIGASFDQMDTDGRPATKSYSAPEGFDGHLLYIREDLVREFTGDRAAVTFGWGERQMHLAWSGDMPERLRRVYRSHQNVWRVGRIIQD